MRLIPLLAARTLVAITGLCIAAAPAHASEDEARVLILNGADPYNYSFLLSDGAMRASLAGDPARRINLRGRGGTFLTVHADRGVMEAAVKEKGDIKVLAVTVLTSTSQADLAAQGYTARLDELVLARARGAVEKGCDGVITSGLEVAAIKRAFGDKLLAVTPGIRPAGGDAGDPKRVVDVAQAFRNGADYIVVGRPIRDAANPGAAAAAIQATIEGIFPA